MTEEDRILRRKLASRRGASITFALLLFLVCTVIGVIVLVAGTASAGRFSRLSESDSRYYAVSSAAQLLRDEIRGREVTVTRSCTTQVTFQTIKYRYEDDRDSDGTPEEYIAEMEAVSKKEPPTYSCSVTSKVPGSTDAFDALQAMPFLKEAAEYYALGALDLDAAAAWDKTVSVEQAAERDLGAVILTLKNADKGKVEGALPVTVSASLNTSGQLLLTLSCKSKAEDTEEAYTAVLTFNPGKKLVEPDSAIPDTVAAPGEGVISRGPEVTVNYEDRKEAIFTWTYAGMKK